MAKQRDNVSGFSLFPEGHYEFIVETKPEKFKTPSGKSTYRKWQFGTIVDGQKKTFKTPLFPWDSKDLLIALGGIVLENGEIEWDDEEIIGKKFVADIVHLPDYKGVIRAALQNVEGEDIEDRRRLNEVEETPEEITEEGSDIPFL